MSVFPPAEADLLAGMKGAGTAQNFSERVISITAVDRAAVLKGIQKEVPMPRVEGISNVVSITAVKTPRASGGMTELLNDIKKQAAMSEGIAATAFSQKFIWQVSPERSRCSAPMSNQC